MIVLFALAFSVISGLQAPATSTQARQPALTVDKAIENLAHSDPEARWRAARALREMGEAAADSVPALTRVIDNDPSIDVRVEAILALGSIGRRSQAAVAALMRLVEKPESKPESHREIVIKLWAVHSLGEGGMSAKAAVPTLIKFLDSATDAEAVISAIIALGKIGPPAREALPAIERHLDDKREVPEWGEVAAEARKAVASIAKSGGLP